MLFNKYVRELDNLEKKQQNIDAIAIMILSILSVINDGVHKEYHLIIIYILLSHLYIIYYSLPEKKLSTLLFIVSFTVFIVAYLVSSFIFDSIYLFFIGIEFALGALYNITKNKLLFIPITLIIIFSPLLSHIVDIPIFRDCENQVISLLIDSFDWIIISVMITTKVYFLGLKSNLTKKCLQIWKKNNEKYVGVNDSVDTSKLDELLEIAYKNHSSFIIKFKEYYPVFCKKIEDLYPNIVITEFEVIALLKLNFTTKEIAQVTNSTVRSIESKKYRIRKKIQIASDVDLAIFFSRL